MNWFPVRAAAAVAVVPVFGLDNPGRALTLLLILAAVILVWIGIDSWQARKPTTGRLGTR